MSGIFGVLLIAVGIVSFRLACYIFHRPNPSHWVRSKLVAEGVTLSMVAMVGFGLGMVINFLAHFGDEPFGLFEIGLMVAIVIASWLLVRFLARRQEADTAVETAGRRTA